MKGKDLVRKLVDIINDKDFKIDDWSSVDTQRLQAVVNFLEGKEFMQTQCGMPIVSDRIW